MDFSYSVIKTICQKIEAEQPLLSFDEDGVGDFLAKQDTNYAGLIIEFFKQELGIDAFDPVFNLQKIPTFKYFDQWEEIVLPDTVTDTKIGGTNWLGDCTARLIDLSNVDGLDTIAGIPCGRSGCNVQEIKLPANITRLDSACFNTDIKFLAPAGSKTAHALGNAAVSFAQKNGIDTTDKQAFSQFFAQHVGKY